MLFDNKKLIKSIGEATVFTGFLAVTFFLIVGVYAMLMIVTKAAGIAMLFTIIITITTISIAFYQTEDKSENAT